MDSYRQVDKFPELEELCDHCGGEGRKINSDFEYPSCPACDGAGYKPTEFGRKILTLMRHNFQAMYEDVQEH